MLRDDTKQATAVRNDVKTISNLAPCVIMCFRRMPFRIDSADDDGEMDGHSSVAE